MRLAKAVATLDGWAPSGAQGGTGPWLSGPADLPPFLAEARRCEGFAAREADFEIAMHAVPTLIGPDHRLQDSAPPLTSTQQVIELIAGLDRAGVTWTNIPRRLGPTRNCSRWSRRATPTAPSACGAATWNRPRRTCSKTICGTSRWWSCSPQEAASGGRRGSGRRGHGYVQSARSRTD